MFVILHAYGIPSTIIGAIRSIYINSTTFVSTEDGNSDRLAVETDILQGDTLAPFLFIIVVDYALRQAFRSCSDSGVLVRERRSTRYPAQYLTDLDFADDIALLSNSIAGAQLLVSQLEPVATAVGLIINKAKTKCLLIGATPGGTFHLKSGSIEDVDDFCYLGSWVRTSQRDLQNRKDKAWAACGKLWKIWKSSKLSRNLKLRLFRATVEPVLLYGSSCWSLPRLK
jgi:hypothetical protein